MNSLFRRCLVAAVLGAFASAPTFAELIDPAALHGKKLLFVVGEPDKDKPSEDNLVQDHLKGLGFEVTLAHDSDPASTASGQDLVVISSTADPDILQGTYRDAAVPVLTWNAYTYPYMEMTGPQVHRDYELIDPARFPGRSFSGLYGYCVNPVNEIMQAAGVTRSHNFGTFYLLQTEITWGRPTMAGNVLASIEDDDGEGALFTYERGATMYDNLPAPARRVGFFLSSNNFHMLSVAFGPGQTDPHTKEWYAGLKLFDASLRWAVSPPPEPPKYDPAGLHANLARAAAGKKLLFVGRKNAFEGKEADEHMVAYLSALGFQVTFVDQDDADTAAQGQDLVIISATCSKYKLANRYEDLTQPFILFDPLMNDTYAFSGRKRYKEFGPHGEVGESDDPATAYINIVGSWSPLAAGLKPGPVRMIKDPDVIGWATPGRAAIVVANFPTNPDECPIFAYEKGATLANNAVNPARRVYFALDNPAYDFLTDSGHALYDAAVLWAISPPGS
jgi:hypothetical protein